MKIISVRHAYPEPTGMLINRPTGLDNVTFLHFFNSVELLVNGEVIVTEPHALILYDTFTPQYFRSPTPLTHDWFHMQINKEELHALGLLTDTVYYPEYTDFITKIVREMEVEFFAHGRNYEKLLSLKTEELLIKISRAVRGEMEPVADKNTVNGFHALRSEIFLRMDEDWQIEAMARFANLSPSRFHAVYKSIFHTSPMEDLISVRINAAKNLLTSGTRPISEIAERVGYRSMPHFTRQFTKHTGLSPSKYREITRKEI